MKVIDLFAGPGGLGEGFSSWTGSSGTKEFKIALSIEKDPVARQTLMLRSFFRQFTKANLPPEYYSYLRGAIGKDDLFNAAPKAAGKADLEAWQAELGKNRFRKSSVRVKKSAPG